MWNLTFGNIKLHTPVLRPFDQIIKAGLKYLSVLISVNYLGYFCVRTFYISDNAKFIFPNFKMLKDSGCKDLRIRKREFSASDNFLSLERISSPIQFSCKSSWFIPETPPIFRIMFDLVVKLDYSLVKLSSR